MFKLRVIHFISILHAFAYETHHHRYTPSEDQFWIFTIIAVGLSCLAGFCSGATQGLLSIDMLSLELKISSGTQEEKEIAAVLLPVISQHHLLLSTLLVGNALACETMPIILHQIAPDWLAIIISSVIIVLFGEIIPSAFTTGPDQLYIGMRMIPFVKVMQSILYIFCYPLSLILDWLLGVNHQQRYLIKDIRGLLNLHVQDAQLTKDQMKLMDSMMEMRHQLVAREGKDIKKVFMVSVDEKYSAELKHHVKVKGFSRIPLFQGQNRDQIIGTFNAKSLLKLSSQDYGRPLAQLVQIQEPLVIPQDTTMLEMLVIFQQKRRNLAFISKAKRLKKDEALNSLNLNNLVQKNTLNIVQIIGLTDVFEEMLDIEIEDEDIHGTLKDNPRHKSKYIELGVIHEETEKGLEQRLLKQTK